MDFDGWHMKQLAGDPDNCPHEAWERVAWRAARDETLNAVLRGLRSEDDSPQLRAIILEVEEMLKGGS
jgi:hypothetical protein